MLFVAEHAQLTDTGRQRPANEDSYLVRSPLFVVADGMGGAQAGEVASRMAVEAFERGFEAEGGAVRDRLTGRVGEANRRIHRLARTDERRAGMGTTLTAAYLDEHDVVVAHVGDSRLYRWRAGVLERMTRDHSLVEELVRQGRLTPEEADEHPQRSIITRALGPEDDVEVDEIAVSARDGDVYLLCSDGLTSMVAERYLGELIAGAADEGGATLTEAAGRLVQAANDAGGRDNITVVLFRVADDGTGAPAGLEEPTVAHEPVVPAVAAGDAQRTRAMPVAGTVPPAPAGAAPSASPEEQAAQRTAVMELPAAPEQEPPRTAGVPVQRRAPREPRRPGERRRWRPSAGPFLVLFLLSCVLSAAYFASQTVYFVGTSRGVVAVYRGLPYDLPFGLDLYTVNYESSLPVASVPPERMAAVTDHEIRALDDANGLVDDLERRRAGAGP